MGHVHKPQHQKQYRDLTEYQQQVLDLFSKGVENRSEIAEKVGCSIDHVYVTLRAYERLTPTPRYQDDDPEPEAPSPEAETNQVALADGGTVQDGITVSIDCECGESHEVTIR